MRLIDADAAKRKIIEEIAKVSSEMSAKAFTVAVGVANMFDCEDDFPTIEAEPVKRGRWITDETAIDSGFTSCSCCHAEYYIGDLQALEGDNAFVIYCPNCGARMGEKNKYGG